MLIISIIVLAVFGFAVVKKRMAIKKSKASHPTAH